MRLVCKLFDIFAITKVALKKSEIENSLGQKDGNQTQENAKTFVSLGLDKLLRCLFSLFSFQIACQPRFDVFGHSIYTYIKNMQLPKGFKFTESKSSGVYSYSSRLYSMEFTHFLLDYLSHVMVSCFNYNGDHFETGSVCVYVCMCMCACACVRACVTFHLVY